MSDVFLWREMPDFRRLAPVPENDGYRRGFYRRWGIENCVICGAGRNAEYTQFRQRLSIKAARGGRERYFIDGRTIAVDDDSYLILNDNRLYGSRFESNIDMESYSIFFRPGMAEEVNGALSIPLEGVLAEGPANATRAVEFSESLHAHDSTVSPVLRYVRHAVQSGVEDGGWYEEQLQFLLQRMLERQRRVALAVTELPALKSATRREIVRRLARAVDLVHSAYDGGIGLAEMAQAACLSKFHFLRLFTELHGVTPHAYLQRKRARVARRLLDLGTLTAAQVARRVGFQSRSTMMRQLARWAPAPESARQAEAR
jgi:AraC family transcriptional regulator